MHRCDIFDLRNDIVIRRDPLVFSTALLRQQKRAKRLSEASNQSQCL
jgi:hypothetical protein